MNRPGADEQHAANKPGREAGYSPMRQLVIARLREFLREPEAVFWVYGFPIVMVVALGIAFRNKPVETITVDVIDNGSPGAWAAKSLADQERFTVQTSEEQTARGRLRTGKTDVVVSVNQEPTKDSATGTRFDYVYDATRPQSVFARETVDDSLERAAGRKDVATDSDELLDEPGGRYIDFLVPGLLGMSLMGGGLWGVGFVTVDMRMRKLLKRFLATPMKKSQFLGGIIISRMAFMIPEVLILLIFARYAFDVRIHGSILDVLLLILLGAASFSGLGLLVASRASTIEAVSGLMNLVMLPMWMLSGIFFSSDRFPDAAQPFIKILPLTPLNDMLRAVMLEGSSLVNHLPQLAILATWGVVTFALGLRWFRWA
jgi:ABC-type multidrug transport system permease subunit